MSKYRRLLTIALVLPLVNLALGQNAHVTSKQLSEQEIDSIFNEGLIKRLQIEFSIYRIYEFNDGDDKHFIAMTENQIKCDRKEACFDSINAYCFAVADGVYTLEWAMKDFILPKGNEVSEEFSISFWTKYFELDDYDGDGIADPIVVYGTLGLNGTDDGRIKILVYHKDKKRAIRHQNGTLDFQRNTQVDKEFYDLPLGIQKRVVEIMEKIVENDHGIFPSGWEKALVDKKLKFDEN